MPHSSSVTRQLRAAVQVFADQLTTVSGWLRPLTAAEYAVATPMGSVRQLVGYMLMLHHEIATAEPTTARPIPLDTLLRAWHRRPARQRAQEFCGSDPGAVLAAELANTTVDFALQPPAGASVVATSYGPVRSVDLLRAGTVMWLCFADDLSTAAPRLVSCPRAPAALASGVRTLAQLFAARHPGHTVEVRVPPHVAVQCGVPGSGPSHSRGTPPNVVECEPEAFFAVLTGRRRWSAELAEHRIRASGAAADLSTMLPLIDPLRPDGGDE